MTARSTRPPTRWSRRPSEGDARPNLAGRRMGPDALRAGASLPCRTPREGGGGGRNETFGPPVRWLAATGRPLSTGAALPPCSPVRPSDADSAVGDQPAPRRSERLNPSCRNAKARRSAWSNERISTHRDALCQAPADLRRYVESAGQADVGT